MLKRINNQKGLTTLELLLIMPFVLIFMAMILNISVLFSAKNTVTTAAREAGRTAATVQQNVDTFELGRQKAIATIEKSLPVNWSVGTSSSGISNVFTPAQDVLITRSGDYVIARVRYHVILPMPGLAKLTNPNASLLERYQTVSATAIFKEEVF